MMRSGETRVERDLLERLPLLWEVSWSGRRGQVAFACQ